MGSELLKILMEQAIVFVILLIHLVGFMNPDVVYHDVEYNFMENNIEKFYGKKMSKVLVNKTVIMVVDGLREDHLATSNGGLMAYAEGLIKKNEAIAYSVKTASPTVTMPRIKSIVTGAVPNFVDVVLNFGSHQLNKNNVIGFAAEKLKIHMYGDETWLKLFPHTFHASDPVTSFFVSDFTEVDRNVSRHVPRVLETNDWDFLILHYLGLDHIGHLEGPKSSLISPKLKQMDRVLETIHKRLNEKNTSYLLIMCGDHGMANIGGHGGDSHEEIFTSALVSTNFMKGKNAKNMKTYGKANQIDFASTLAIYLGLLVPENNVGVPLYDVISHLSVEHKLIGQFKVTRQLVNFARRTQDEKLIVDLVTLYNKILKAHFELINEFKLEEIDEKLYQEKSTRLIVSYEQIQDWVSDILSEKLATYDLLLLLSTSLTLLMIAVPRVTWSLFFTKNFEKYTLFPFIFSLFSLIFVAFLLKIWIFSSLNLTYVCVVILGIFGVVNLACFGAVFTYEFSLTMILKSTLELIFVLGILMQPLSLLSTSLVEEEHFSFYFVISMGYFVTFSTLVAKCCLIFCWHDSIGEEPVNKNFNLLDYQSYYSGNKLSSNCKSFDLRLNGRSQISAMDSRETVLSDEYLGIDVSEAYLLQLKEESDSKKSKQSWRGPSLFYLDSKLLFFFDSKNKRRVLSILQTHFRSSKMIKYWGHFHIFLAGLFFCSWGIFRSLQSFNATGDKWKHLEKMNNYLMLLEDKELCIVVVFSVLVVFLLYRSKGVASIFVAFFLILVILRHFPSKRDKIHGRLEVVIPQLAYLMLLIFIILSLYKFIKSFKKQKTSNSEPLRISILLQILETTFALLFILLQRKENLLVVSLTFLHYHLLFPIFVKNLKVLGLQDTHFYIFSYWVAQAHFFIMGNSNSLSTVRIHSGFVGISSYQPVLHGFLIAFHTFGAEFLTLLHALNVIAWRYLDLKRLYDCLQCWWVLNLLSLTLYVCTVTLQRNHLFIWSVFAPKLLYLESHFLVLAFLTLLTYFSVRIVCK